MIPSPRGSRSAEPASPQLLVRIQAEFLEMPGLCLTTEQAARLWNVDCATASWLLDSLVATGFLALRDRKFARTAG